MLLGGVPRLRVGLVCRSAAKCPKKIPDPVCLIRHWMFAVAMMVGCVTLLSPALGQNAPSDLTYDDPLPITAPIEGLPDEPTIEPMDMQGFITSGPEEWLSRQGLSSSLQIMLLLTVLTLAPAILLMTTCFVRIVVVLGLLRQALGTQQLPPSQVITSIAMFMTLLLMWPVWTDAYNSGIGPYTQGQINPETNKPYELFSKEGGPPEAWERAALPVRRFMAQQIEVAGNSDDVWLFYQYYPPPQRPPETYDDVPTPVLLPAFMLSELKVAFLIGFQIYLPFLILDIVVASVTISMGMLMLPPVMISLPFKLLLFVLVDGWHLVVGMLLESFVPYT